jgi:8-oxo-dGTP pyrophosphatase MutT (NUDIX family)
MIDANLGGEALRAYGVTSSYGAGESVLRPLEGSFSVALTAQWNAGPSDPPLYIPSGAFHASENSPTSDWESWSVTVVATENVSDNKSRVLGPISGRSEVVNPRKETLKVDEILSVIDTEDRRFTEGANKWASFVFIVSSGKILMARTYHYPEYWQPLGGQMEVSDRGPEATARREVLEELGVCLDPLKMRSLGDVPRDRGPGRVFAWLYDMDEPQSLNIQEQEIREIAWLEPADAYQRATFPATHEFLERILRMSAS